MSMKSTFTDSQNHCPSTPKVLTIKQTNKQTDSVVHKQFTQLYTYHRIVGSNQQMPLLQNITTMFLLEVNKFQYDVKYNFENKVYEDFMWSFLSQISGAKN